MLPAAAFLPSASVVICTRNRSRQLLEACQAVARIDYPEDLWEVLIVDNSSTDDTLEVAHGFAAEHSDLVRVVVEKELGLSAARNAGIRHTQGDIVAFIDDDAIPEAGWLKALAEALQLPSAMAAGGPVDPIFAGDLPAWLDERYLPYMTVWDLGAERQELKYNEYPRGANVAFRRDALRRYGNFSTHLGRKGKSLLSCEEIELCLRLERGGGKIFYVPGARVGHHVNAERISEDWMLDRFGAQGRSEAIVDWQHGGLAGLRLGRRRFSRYAREARSQQGPSGDLNRRLQKCSLRAYTWSALSCPLRVPRYCPPDPVRPWLPSL